MTINAEDLTQSKHRSKGASEAEFYLPTLPEIHEYSIEASFECLHRETPGEYRQKHLSRSEGTPNRPRKRSYPILKAAGIDSQTCMGCAKLVMLPKALSTCDSTRMPIEGREHVL